MGHKMSQALVDMYESSDSVLVYGSEGRQIKPYYHQFVTIEPQSVALISQLYFIQLWIKVSAKCCKWHVVYVQYNISFLENHKCPGAMLIYVVDLESPGSNLKQQINLSVNILDIRQEGD